MGEGIEASSLPFIDGLVLLWATKKVLNLLLSLRFLSFYSYLFLLFFCSQCFVLRRRGSDRGWWKQCYLEVWRYASAFSPTSTFSSLEGDADGGALRKEFIPNWASDKFAEFVEKIGGGGGVAAARDVSHVTKLRSYKRVLGPSPHVFKSLPTSCRVIYRFRNYRGAGSESRSNIFQGSLNSRVVESCCARIAGGWL